MIFISELAYSLHLGSDKNKKNVSREKAKTNKSGTTSLSNNAIQNASHLTRVDKHNYRKYDDKQDDIVIVRGTDSLVNDVITPMLSILTGKVDFSRLFFALDGNTYSTIEEAYTAGTTVVNYGQFITNIVDFLMIALCLFISLKIIFKFKGKKEEKTKPVTTKICPYCMNEIPIAATRCGHCTSKLKNEN